MGKSSSGNYLSIYSRKFILEKNTTYVMSVGKPLIRSQYSECIREFTLVRSLTNVETVESLDF